MVKQNVNSLKCHPPLMIFQYIKLLLSHATMYLLYTLDTTHLINLLYVL